MSLILDGTNGLSDVDGSASTPAIRGTDTNTGIFFPAADTIAFAEGGAEVARFDSSGNLGIGTSSPTSQIQLNKSGTGDYTTLRLSNSGASGRTYEIGLGGNTAASGYANTLYFYDSNAGAIRMAIDSAGRVNMPSQPMMYASGYGGGSSSGSANPLILTSSLLNIGSNFNTGNGRFTAPVAGRYQAIFTGLKQGSGGADYLIRKNGTTVIGAYATGDVATFATHIVLELAASDYITFSAGGSWYTDYTSYSVQLVS